MKTVPLEEIAEVRLGRQRSPKNHSGPQNRSYVRAANVGWDGLKLDDVKTMNFTDAEMDIYRLRPGDLLLNEASGSPHEVGKPAMWMGEIEECAFQNTLLRVRPTAEVESRYLFHYLRQQALTAAFARGSRGVGIHHLGREALSKWPIPLPPLDKQRRIAAILDRADAVQGRCRRALQLVDQLRSAAFLEFFGDPVDNPYNWRRMRLGDLVECITAGESPVCEGRPAAQGEWGVLKLGAVSYGQFNPNESKAFLGDVESLKKVEVKPGDFLFSRKNTKELVGATVVVPKGIPRRLLLPDLIFRLDLIDSEIDAEYLHGLLKNAHKRTQLVALASGSASSMSNISQARLRELTIEIPPIEKQRTFAQYIRGVDRVRDTHQRALPEVGALVTSLQSRAFSGRL